VGQRLHRSTFLAVGFVPLRLAARRLDPPSSLLMGKFGRSSSASSGLGKPGGRLSWLGKPGGARRTALGRPASGAVQEDLWEVGDGAGSRRARARAGRRRAWELPLPRPSDGRRSLPRLPTPPTRWPARKEVSSTDAVAGHEGDAALSTAFFFFILFYFSKRADK
jgi:hypothetical protein